VILLIAMLFFIYAIIGMQVTCIGLFTVFFVVLSLYLFGFHVHYSRYYTIANA